MIQSEGFAAATSAMVIAGLFLLVLLTIVVCGVVYLVRRSRKKEQH